MLDKASFELITVEKANQLIAENARDFGMEAIPLEEGIGRVLREPIIADRDFPPYDRVTMDGIAIQFEDYRSGTRSFKISGVAAAGAEKMMLQSPNECLEVMTGAIIPDGLDTVIQYEHLAIKDRIASLQVEGVNKRQNIHFKGMDRKQGDEVIHPGKKISSPEIGVCATVGKQQIEVSRLPRTIIVSSGDELVEIDEIPEAHQIRRSNVYRLKAVLNHYHIQADTAHLPDRYEPIVRKLEQLLSAYELIILSGGISRGKFDFLPEALEEVGVKKYFHRVAQRPGKPFWFGSKEETTVFALPGNPVSSFMCVQQYFKPWLDRCLQLKPQPKPKAVLGKDVVFKPDLTYFLEVKLNYSDEGQLTANPVKGNGSGDLANLVYADAFMVLPGEKSKFFKGEVYPVIFYR